MSKSYLVTLDDGPIVEGPKESKQTKSLKA
jgi:hypothetical protein